MTRKIWNKFVILDGRKVTFCTDIFVVFLIARWQLLWGVEATCCRLIGLVWQRCIMQQSVAMLTSSNTFLPTVRSQSFTRQKHQFT